MIFRSFILSILFSYLPLFIFAQDSTTVAYHPSVWAEVGAGFVGEQIGFEFSTNFSISQNGFMSVSYDRAALPFDDLGKASNEGQSFSIRFGGLSRGKVGLWQYAFGLSWVSGTHYSRYAMGRLKDDFSTIGLTGKLGGLLSPNIIGLGLVFFAHVNSEYTYGGLTLNLALGQINGRVKK